MSDIILHQPMTIPNTKDQLGESPIWCFRSDSLLWVDIKKGQLFRLYPKKNNLIEVSSIPLLTSSVLLTSVPEVFLLVHINGLYLLDYQNKSTVIYHKFSFDDPHIRTNEAQISPEGQLFFSTMDKTASRNVGAIYALEFGGALKAIHSGMHIPNTLQWYQDELWFMDSGKRIAYQKNLNTEATQQYSVNYTADGSALTTEGLLINACWGDHCLAIYDLNIGFQLIQTIIIDSMQPTSCAFADDDLSTLYVTSAYDGLENPTKLDGTLTKIESCLQGVKSNVFIL